MSDCVKGRIHDDHGYDRGTCDTCKGKGCENVMEKSKCDGCYNDEYNRGLGGAKQCWSLEDAKIVWRKRVHINQMPPWKQKAERYPSCYRVQQYVFVKPNQEN